MRILQAMLASVLSVVLFLGVPVAGIPSGHAEAATSTDVSLAEINKTIEGAANHILDSGVSSEWEAIGLAAAGYPVPEAYYQNHFSQSVDSQVINPSRYAKITDIERHVIAAAAIGLDSLSVNGTDLIEKIYNSHDVSPGNDTMTLQGNNGPIFALIALDSQQFEVPSNAKWTRQKLIDELLKQQNEDGSWSLSAYMSGPSYDITAMALIALAPYTSSQGNVKKAVDSALSFLSAEQQSSGGFDDPFVGGTSSEATSQVIIALTSNGIDPTSKAFTKGSNNLVTHLLSFKSEDGGFMHVSPGNSNGMATEQALQALVAYQKFLKGEGKLYSFPKPLEPEPPTPMPDPTLTIKGVEDGQIVTTPEITVTAEAKDGEGSALVVDAKLNDQALEGNKSGEFVLSLKEGKNFLIVSAQDQNEKVVSKKVTIQYKKEAEDEDPPKLLDQVTLKPEWKDGKGTIEMDSISNLKEGGDIIIEIPDDSVTIVFPDESMSAMVNKGATLHLESSQVKMKTELKGFSKKEAEFSIQRMEGMKEALSNVYDFTIKQDGKSNHDVKDAVELSFAVKEEEVDSTSTAVYFYNADTGKWDHVGGDYSDGWFSVQPDHLSTFAVFNSAPTGTEEEEKTNEPEKTQDEGKTGSSPKENKKDDTVVPAAKPSSGKKLPNTGVNEWYLPVAGGLLLLTGLSIYFWGARKKRKMEIKG
ncbi:terpene cyclase/mutase family protein [Rossellomorea marisflavi]|uniref:prenyltransferase/squalene oxidase repeat-containing protein n=1 Tax=Rossellomorea marisflavi TaxID=189381 RepID=UPI0025B1734E|nr:prenyltransferase/squalene oxidase repeat-containing protein [Rossellomorea marisflavi]WJV19710.1 terpene cyclase/mutase family protein [Rossellomorea marisflavi]